ncbi:hypothetical protein [Massilia phyllosphaerae]|nr:hypothetical protein [Massilia sp. SGZ-792]
MRIHRYGNPDALSRRARPVPDIAGAHAPGESGRAADQVMLPAGTP